MIVNNELEEMRKVLEKLKMLHRNSTGITEEDNNNPQS
jgi:hypothetical protein